MTDQQVGSGVPKRVGQAFPAPGDGHIHGQDALVIGVEDLSQPAR
jgi:hypothetical protein